MVSYHFNISIKGPIFLSDDELQWINRVFFLSRLDYFIYRKPMCYLCEISGVESRNVSFFF